MGMSATQARFLSLTARKSNVEFEGQQINQQRTTLSNESASYYSELCNMEVPTPPSVDDYTKVTYTFNDGAMTNTITSLIARGSGEYSVNYLQQWQDDYSITPAASAMVARSTDAESGAIIFQIGTKRLRDIGDVYKTVPVELNEEQITNLQYFYFPDGVPQDLSEANISAFKVTKNEAGKYVDSQGQEVTDFDESKLFMCSINTKADNANGAIQVVAKEGNKYYYPEIEEIVPSIDDEYLNSLNPDQLVALAEEEKYYTNLLKDKFGDNTQWNIRYVKNSTTGSYEPYFYKTEDLNNADKYTANDLANINCFSLGSSTQTKEVLNQKAVVEKDSSGRYIGITLFDKDGNQTTHSLTTTTTTDEEAYNDAMNQYHYKQHEYDHKIQEINSKLEIIQQQDKNLELKLKQLDTEENAISTELDAVKKVISKNVESSFKTFNA